LRFVSFLDASHTGEGVAVLAQRLVAGMALELAQVLEDELALLGVAALLVALHAQAGADLAPDFLHEVSIEALAARRAVVRLTVFGTRTRGRDSQRNEDDDQRTGREGHREPLDARRRRGRRVGLEG